MPHQLPARKDPEHQWKELTEEALLATALPFPHLELEKRFCSLGRSYFILKHSSGHHFLLEAEGEPCQQYSATALLTSIWFTSLPLVVFRFYLHKLTSCQVQRQLCLGKSTSGSCQEFFFNEIHQEHPAHQHIQLSPRLFPVPPTLSQKGPCVQEKWDHSVRVSMISRDGDRRFSARSPGEHKHSSCTSVPANTRQQSRTYLGRPAPAAGGGEAGACWQHPREASWLLSEKRGTVKSSQQLTDATLSP